MPVRSLSMMVVLLAAGAASAQTMAAGEYSITISGFGPKPQIMKQCMAEQTTDKAMTPNLEALSDCPTREVTKTATGMKMNFVCDGMTMKGTGTVGDGFYRSEMTLERPGEPPMRMVTEVKRIGPCKPGQKPEPAP